ncbi:MAG TPA: hypothetical protein VIS71_06485 [Terrimicrobium sp.]
MPEGLPVALEIADGLARLSQLEFAKASGGKELLHDLLPILLHHLAAALSGITAGMDEVAVHGCSFVKVFHSASNAGLSHVASCWRTALQPGFLAAFVIV